VGERQCLPSRAQFSGGSCSDKTESACPLFFHAPAVHPLINTAARGEDGQQKTCARELEGRRDTIDLERGGCLSSLLSRDHHDTDAMADVVRGHGHACEPELPDDLHDRVPSLQRLAAEVLAATISRNEVGENFLQSSNASEVRAHLALRLPTRLPAYLPTCLPQPLCSVVLSIHWVARNPNPPSGYGTPTQNQLCEIKLECKKRNRQTLTLHWCAVPDRTHAWSIFLNLLPALPWQNSLSPLSVMFQPTLLHS
jgi:hypothetical protein